MQKGSVKSLPVLMHHLISNDTRFLSVEPAVFEEQCRILAKNGWFGVGLEEAEDFLIHGKPLPKKSFLLTFDDGYLDNYVYAWPIMQKYGHKGVIFALTDKLDQAQQAVEKNKEPYLRPTITDVEQGLRSKDDFPTVDSLIHQDAWGHNVRKDLYFTWDEARAMEKSGTIAIAAHSTQHARVFTSPNYSSLYQPGHVSRPFEETVPAHFWGTPFFDYAPELANRAFIPSPDMFEEIKMFVPQNKETAVAFFASPSARKDLDAIIKKYKNNIGRYETEDEQQKRFHKIMYQCQDTLQNELGHKIRSFCWPWGSYCDEAREEGLANGFEVFYTTRIGINKPQKPLAVNRFKVKNRKDGGAWLQSRIRLYSRPLLGGLYLKMRI